MLIGYDTAQDPCVLSAVRSSLESNITAGLLLNGYGTVPDGLAVADNGIEKGVQAVAAHVLDQMDGFFSTKNAADLHFAAAKIHDSLRAASSKIRKIAHYIGQGIYMGGVIAYFSGSDYILIPFGGGTAYTYDNAALVRQGASASPDGFIRDAVGGAEPWSAKVWKGKLGPAGCLILATDELPATQETRQRIASAGTPGNHIDTAAMMLRRSVENGSRFPAAVMILRHAAASGEETASRE